MTLICGQCGAGGFGSQRELERHLLVAHGLNENPEPRSLPNLYEVVEALTKRVDILEAEVKEEFIAIDSRLEDLEEPDV